MIKRRGFTLLELIVAMGIMVLVVTTITYTIASAFKLKQSADNAIDATRDTEIVGDVFVHELGNAVVPNTNSQDPSVLNNTGVMGVVTDTVIPNFLAGAFIGDQTTLSFYTTGTSDKATVPADIRYVEFGVSQQKDGLLAFVRRERLNLLEDASQTTDPTEEPLVEGVESVEFEYYDGTAWQNTWDSTTNGNLLPFAVSMQLTIKPLLPDQPSRIIKRFATVYCAAPATQAADTTGTGIGG